MRIPMLLMALTLPVTALGQDVEGWIKKLGASDFELREQAQKKLVEIGEPALKALREATKSDDAEIAIRAGEVVDFIERNLLIRKASKAGTRVTLSVQGVPASEAAEKLATASGYTIRLPEAVKAKEVTLELRDAEFLRALDTLAKQVGRAYEFKGKSVVFSSEAFVDYPAAYQGAYKFAITNIRTTTDNAITRRKTTVDFVVAIQSEPGATPAESQVRITSAADGKGQEVKWEKEPKFDREGLAITSMTVNGKTIRILGNGGNVQVIEQGGTPAASQRVSLNNIGTSIAAFSSVKGETSISIPTGADRKVGFRNPVAGQKQTVGDVEVTIESVEDMVLEVSVRGKDGAKLPKDILNEDSILIRSGKDEIEAEIASDQDFAGDRDLRRLMWRVRRLQHQSGEQGRSFLIRIPKKAQGSVDGLNFTIKETVTHTVPFEFKDVDVR